MMDRHNRKRDRWTGMVVPVLKQNIGSYFRKEEDDKDDEDEVGDEDEDDEDEDGDEAIRNPDALWQRRFSSTDLDHVFRLG
mmetsp:Transcript_7956/g.23502  ORF Transcript_7956/g.23502 Transcript_7956/m.23502 type:complete len:81 (-) Transcript_7956:32-274(-)